MNARTLSHAFLGMLAWLGLGGASAGAQTDLAKAFAPTGTLRVGVLMVT